MAFTRILCPIDFSAPSRTALRHAAEIALDTGGHLTVLFVNDLLLATAASAAALDTDAIARSLRGELKTFVRRALAGRRLPTEAVDLSIAIGQAAPEILNTARALRADLIVMGTQGRSGARRILLGSTTEHVLRKAGVPVLAVPPGAKRVAGRSRPRPSSRGRRR